MPKITVIGAGQVGSTLALRLSDANIQNIAVIDIAKNIVEGKCLDLQDAAAAKKINSKIEFGDDFSLAKDSDIVVITAGLPRKPGMTRDDLLETNLKIIKQVAEGIKKSSPNAFVICITNPLDVIVMAL